MKDNKKDLILKKGKDEVEIHNIRIKNNPNLRK